MQSNFLLTYRRFKHPVTKDKFYQIGISENYKPYKWLRRRFKSAAAAISYGEKLKDRLLRMRLAV